MYLTFKFLSLAWRFVWEKNSRQNDEVSIGWPMCGMYWLYLYSISFQSDRDKGNHIRMMNGSICWLCNHFNIPLKCNCKQIQWIFVLNLQRTLNKMKIKEHFVCDVYFCESFCLFVSFYTIACVVALAITICCFCLIST